MNPAPDTPEAIVPNAPQPEKPKRSKLLIGGAVGLAGAVLAAGAVIGIKAATDGSANAAPEKDPAETSQAPTPEETSAPEQELTVEALEIPGTLSPEEAATVLVNERLSPWMMAGAMQSTVDAWYEAGGAKDYLASVAAHNATIFADALFVPAWKSDETLSHYVDFEAGANATILELWLLTRESGDPRDRKPFERVMTIDSVGIDESSEGTASLSITATESDNRDQNRAGDLADDTFTSPNLIAGDITLQQVDGSWKIAAIEWSARD